MTKESSFMSPEPEPREPSPDNPQAYAATGRSGVRRHAERGRYDAATVNAILDASPVCHVGFVHDNQPFVVPVNYARAGNSILLHGSPGSRMLRLAGAGADLCVTVTIVDGIVLARSVFNHSMNYRSVVLFGKGSTVDGLEEKREALRLFTEKLLPGRWSEVRQPTDAEIEGTLVIRIVIDEASAKVRSGPPVDQQADAGLPVWAGVLPLRMMPGEPVPDAAAAAVPLPESVRQLQRALRDGGV